MGAISADDYAQDLDNTRLFLQGKSRDIVNNLVARMDAAAIELRYEEAAALRDQIQEVQKVAERQSIASGAGDLDIVAAGFEAQLCCVHVHFIRAGQSLGGKTLFPKVPKGADAEDVLTLSLIHI